MRGRRVGSPAQVPAALEQLPGDLEGDGGLAGAGGERQQDAVACRRRWLPARARWRCPGSSAPASVPPLSSNGTAAKRSRQSFGSAKVSVPQLVRRRVASTLALRAGLHVDAVDAVAVGGIGEARLPAWRRSPWPAPTPSVSGLSHALASITASLCVAVDQHVVGDLRLAAPPCALDAAGADDLAADPAVGDDAPAAPSERGRCVRRGSRLRSLRRLFDGVRRRRGQFAGEGFLQDRLFLALQ